MATAKRSPTPFVQFARARVAEPDARLNAPASVHRAATRSRTVLPRSSERLTLEVSLAAQNLTDEAARNPIAITNDQVLLAGRIVRLGLRGPL